MDHHVHRTPRLGTSVLISESWYKSVGAGYTRRFALAGSLDVIRPPLPVPSVLPSGTIWFAVRCPLSHARVMVVSPVPPRAANRRHCAGLASGTGGMTAARR